MKNYAVVNNETNEIVNVIVVGEFIPEIENCKLIDTTGKDNAQVGGTYDEENERFIDIQPYPSWILNDETGLWEAPIPKPDVNYFWKETDQTWEEIQ
jgi:hypothetical protein